MISLCCLIIYWNVTIICFMWTWLIFKHPNHLFVAFITLWYYIVVWKYPHLVAWRQIVKQRKTQCKVCKVLYLHFLPSFSHFNSSSASVKNCCSAYYFRETPKCCPVNIDLSPAKFYSNKVYTFIDLESKWNYNKIFGGLGFNNGSSDFATIISILLQYL